MESLPDVRNIERFMPSGEISASRAARMISRSLNMLMWLCMSVSPLSCSAWTIRGWLWPRAAHIWPELKSRYSLPLTSRTTEPRPQTMMGPVTMFLSMRLRKLNFLASSSSSASVSCCVIVSTSICKARRMGNTGGLQSAAAGEASQWSQFQEAWALNLGITSLPKASSCSRITFWGVPITEPTLIWSRPG